MVLACKIFALSDITIEETSEKLKWYKVEEEAEEIKIIQEFKDLQLGEHMLKGTYSYDELKTSAYHGKERLYPTTKEIPFVFYFSRDGDRDKDKDGNRDGDKIFLLVVERKGVANKLANLMSKILFIQAGKVTEPKIPPEKLREFTELGEGKVIFFDDVNIPSINKLSLYGSYLKDTDLYQSYLKHGKPWYVVFKNVYETKEFVIGLTRNGVVTMFSRCERDEFVDFIVERILVMI